MKPYRRGVLEEMLTKYLHLVWYARKTPEDTRTHPQIIEAMQQVILDYPEEVARLYGDAGDWEHGFNSGMLAALRLFGAACGSDAEWVFAVDWTSPGLMDTGFRLPSS